MIVLLNENSKKQKENFVKKNYEVLIVYWRVVKSFTEKINLFFYVLSSILKHFHSVSINI